MTPGWRLTWALALSAVLAGLSVWSWRIASREGRGLLWTVVPGVVAVLAPLFGWLLQQRAQGGDEASRLDGARADLAKLSASRWRIVEATRGALAPWPLPVRWRTSERARAVMVDRSAVRASPGADEPIELSGEYREIADVFCRPDSPRRLVVLGEPGAGKTMLSRTARSNITSLSNPSRYLRTPMRSGVVTVRSARSAATSLI